MKPTGDRKRKKVLLVVRWPVGGIRTFLSYVYRSFDPEEWAFTLVAPERDELNLLLENDLSHLGIEYFPVRPRPSARHFASRIAGLLFSRRFDLVHSHGFTSGVLTALSASLRGTKHLMTPHDIINASHFIGFKGACNKFAMARLFGTMVAIHSVSFDAQENFRSFFGSIRKDRCRVIPHGIDVERFEVPVARDLRSELSLKEEHFLIGFMGRFMAPKGFRYLLDAVEILSRRDDLARKPLVLCFGWGGFIREEQDFIAKRGLTDYFRFLPFAANIAPSIKGMDVVAMPSLWEACGLLAMEVLVSGSPLIATNCIGLREVIKGTPATVVPPRDGQALAAAIIRHMKEDNTQVFRDFAQVASRRFDVARQTAGMLDLYRQLTFRRKREG